MRVYLFITKKSVKKQLKIDDYMNENGFLGKNCPKKVCKKSISEDDDLLKNDDSLAFFTFGSTVKIQNLNYSNCYYK